VYQYRNGFIQAMREGNRNRIFLMLEQRHAADFANGPAGVKYYATLLEAVRSANVPEAVEEFQRRFLPLLVPDGTRSRPAHHRAARFAGVGDGPGPPSLRRRCWRARSSGSTPSELHRRAPRR
jgi:hypothetical protein